MNEILKQRLVGALILVALGVVFWPIIFLQPEDKTVTYQQPIPPSPGVSTLPIGVPSAGELRASSDLARPADSPDVGELADADSPREWAGAAAALPSASSGSLSQPSSANTVAVVRNKAPEPLAMDSNGIPLAWTLQVVTVSSADKAELLRKKLLDMRHKAYIVIVRSNGKKLYRVCIGPKFERVELETLQASIDAQFKVNSIVARYTP